jgi:hypothetical protein
MIANDRLRTTLSVFGAGAAMVSFVEETVQILPTIAGSAAASAECTRWGSMLTGFIPEIGIAALGMLVGWLILRGLRPSHKAHSGMDEIY